MPKNLKGISNRQGIRPSPKKLIKPLLILWILFFGFQTLKAQEGTHQHDGFYLSMSGGVAFGTVTDHLSSSLDAPYTLTFNGQGVVLDVKIGWAVKENLILHATLISNTVSNPTIEQKNNQHPTYDEYLGVVDVGDAMVGAGLTYYVMPSNIFFSGSMGMGKFMVSATRYNHEDITAATGLSMQLKLGKEWWISKNWGLGIGLTYGNTTVSCEPRIKQSEKMSSNRFGIVLNTTFN